MSNEQANKLTTALYQEGVARGEKRAAEIIEEAQAKAALLMETARKDVEKIMQAAEEKAQTQKSHVETEIRIAAREIIHDFHQKVVDMILFEAVDQKLSSALSDSNQLIKWVSTIIENWRCDLNEQPDLEILLSRQDIAIFKKWFEDESRKILSKKIKINFSDSLDAGFIIVPTGGTYKIDMSLNAFQELFRRYLKTKTRKLIFGE
ncbi:MAG: V-type ATP synthase subunit E family protein [Spirochaetia bacterium]|nr:V-type ATP synthase subunit E family protein [Spirochaetia bacterium]